ncbi:UNVERIFIED_ORG: putative ATPase [Arthrobacter sp. UYEF1]
MKSHDDKVRQLRKRFDAKARYANFGPVLEGLTIRGFRGVKDLELEFESPITALSGLNGTGKSTIAQLACCAYRKSDTAADSRFYVKDFFPVSAIDPTPFELDGSVVYSYAIETPPAATTAVASAAVKQVTVRRAQKEWSGYKRQPGRSCYYVGFTQFIPKVERRDFSVYGGKALTVGASVELSEEATAAIGRILGLKYETLDFTAVVHSKRTTDLAMARRDGKRYSENHMGFGEGRIVYMVSLMERALNNSLFVLEEPETSLHGDAQRRLAQYLVDVCDRKGHQIILTTHSAAIMGEFGRESVVYLRRAPAGGLTATSGLSTYQIDSYLQTRPADRATICVEDEFAATYAREVFRKHNPDLLAGANMVAMGSGQALPKGVAEFRKAGLRVVGISDGDMKHHDGPDGVTSFPGFEPPEKQIFWHDSVFDHFTENYGTDIRPILASTTDHHSYVAAISRDLSLDEGHVATLACQAYVASEDLAAEMEKLVSYVSKQVADRR